MQKVRVFIFNVNYKNLTDIMQKGRQLQEFNIYYAKSSCVFIFNVNYKNLTYIMQKVRVCLYLTSTTRI